MELWGIDQGGFAGIPKWKKYGEVKISADSEKAQGA
jgi:hypothetical protein